MAFASEFKRMFKGACLEAEDLFLLEPFQIGYLPGWVPEQEFAAVLSAHPSIRRFLVARCPTIAAFIERILAQPRPSMSQDELKECTDRVVWTIADLLVYNKCPEVYDSLDFHNWDFSEVTSIVALDEAVVIDGGAGTGRVALEAARTAKWVFAVEPVARLREFIREKASEADLSNVFVLDGFLHAIPLPDRFADILITSHALGWRLEEELAEFERVVRADGFILHCPGTAETAAEEQSQHSLLLSPEWHYDFSRYRESDGWKRKYWKRL